MNKKGGRGTLVQAAGFVQDASKKMGQRLLNGFSKGAERPALLVAALASLMASAAFSQSQFAGTYAGTYSGKDSGKWQMVIDVSGAVTRFISSSGDSSMVGGVDSAGALQVVIDEGDTITTTLTGKILAAGSVSGRWVGSEGDSGTFKGSRSNSTAPMLPAWVQGAFNGYVEGCGAASMSVSDKGAVSGKITMGGTNYSFSATASSSGQGTGQVFSVSTTAKAGNAVLPLNLQVTRSSDSLADLLGIATGQLGDGLSVTMYRNVWKDPHMAEMAKTYANYYTATLSGGDGSGSGYLAFTVDMAGGVKAAGKLADGTAVSLSGPLIIGEGDHVFAVLYTAPAAYKGGCFFGLAQFVDANGDGKLCVSPLECLWESHNPQATGDYEAGGFSRAPGLAGGVYSKTIDLRSYYANGLTVGGIDTLPTLLAKIQYAGSGTYEEPQDAVAVSPEGLALSVTPATGAGTGLAAPKAQTPSKVSTDPDTGEVQYNYDDLTDNPTGLTVNFTRATGIFKGSFNVYFDYASAENITTGKQTWMHVTKSVSYEGILTPVRWDTSDGVAGRGFFLWADKGSYDSGRVDRNEEPIMTTYSFNDSYDFLLSVK